MTEDDVTLVPLTAEHGDVILAALLAQLRTCRKAEAMAVELGVTNCDVDWQHERARIEAVIRHVYAQGGQDPGIEAVIANTAVPASELNPTGVLQ